MKEIERKLDILSERLKMLQENEQNELYAIVSAQNELLQAQNELLHAQSDQIEKLYSQTARLSSQIADLIELLSDSSAVV